MLLIYDDIIDCGSGTSFRLDRSIQPRSKGSLLPALRSERGRVGENPGNEVVNIS